MAESKSLGVVVRLKRDDKGKLFLLMDDVVLILEDPERWERIRLFTEKEVPEDQFMTMALADEQLADIGMMVVARLAALAKHSKSG